MDKPPLKPVSLDANLLGQFWTSAADVFIEIVKSQDPDVRQSIDRSISSGGDVEITAHNQAERITVTLIEESGQRQVIFDDMVVAVKRFIFVAILTIIGSAPALADVRIVLSLGGTVGSYLSFFSRVRQSGQRVIIDGPCLSACTLVLSTIPRSRVCVTSRAVLGFHAPVVVDQYGRRFRSREATRAVVAAYPPRVRSWIRRQGGLTNNVILLRGSELATLYPRCRR